MKSTIISMAALASIVTALPSGISSQSVEKRVAGGAYKKFGECNMNVNIRLPPIPELADIATLETAVASASITADRMALFNNADPFAVGGTFPRWYTTEVFPEGTAPRLFMKATVDMPAKSGNTDHVFEHFTLRQFIASQIGGGDPLPGGLPQDPAKCTLARNLMTAPLSTTNPVKVLQAVWSNLQGYDAVNPTKFVGTDFAGLNSTLNTIKGSIFQAQMSKYLGSDWAIGTTEPQMNRRMADIEHIYLVFQLMQDPLIQAAYKRTCFRMSKVLYGLDAYIAANPAFLMNAAGDTWPSFGDNFKTWLPEYLNYVGTQAQLFVADRVAALTADLSDPTIGPFNDVQTRLLDFTTAAHDAAGYYVLDQTQMVELSDGTPAKTILLA